MKCVAAGVKAGSFANRYCFPVFSGVNRRQVGILAGLSVLAFVFSLSACSGPNVKSNTKLSKRIIPFGRSVPKGGGRYKVGSPYKVDGRWYYPRKNRNYDQIGTASWYGEMFHGRETANGEIYDMDAITAAHPTLPMPVYAKVTNLENGRNIIVRVNDRGPYKRSRIIDLSRRSATVLGFRIRGTARVRVQYLAQAPLNGDDSYEKRYLASRPWMRPYTAAIDRKPGRIRSAAWLTATSAKGPVNAATAANIYPTGAITPLRRKIFIQAGSFRSSSNANRLRERLAAYGPVRIDPLQTGKNILYRVRLGPFAHDQIAGQILRKLVGAGVNDAMIIGE